MAAYHRLEIFGPRKDTDKHVLFILHETRGPERNGHHNRKRSKNSDILPGDGTPLGPSKPILRRRRDRRKCHIRLIPV